MSQYSRGPENFKGKIAAGRKIFGSSTEGANLYIGSAPGLVFQGLVLPAGRQVPQVAGLFGVPQGGGHVALADQGAGALQVGLGVGGLQGDEAGPGLDQRVPIVL